MSGKKRASSSTDADEWLVVTTTYPTTYGCNRGRSWSRAELIARSDVDTKGPYESHSKAIEAARRVRNRSDYFTDACAPDPEDCSDDEMDDDEDNDEYVFNNEDEPPYDSAVLENWDNDEEEIIEVMTRDEFEQRQADNEAFLRKAGMERRYQFTVKDKIAELRIKDAGKVHYSTPPKPCDIKAELEVVEEDARDMPMAELMKQEDVERGTAIPPNASEIKSLMYLGGKKELGEFSKKCRRGNKEEIEEGLGSTPFLQLIAVCTSLEELYLKKDFGNVISPELVDQIVSVAPHLKKTLKVLSLGLIEVEPEALPSLSAFKKIERLDLQNSLNSFCGGAVYFEPSFGYGSDSDDERKDRPYDKGLINLVESLPNLKRLDLGYGDQSMQQHFFEYVISPHVIWTLRRKLKERNGVVTMDDENMGALRRKRKPRCVGLLSP